MYDFYSKNPFLNVIYIKNTILISFTQKYKNLLKKNHSIKFNSPNKIYY